MSSESNCPKCKAKVRAGTKFCPYCMVKLEGAPEPEPLFVAPPVEVPQAFEAPSRREGTGQDDLLASAAHVLGGAPEVVMLQGEVLHGYALWQRADHLVLLTLGFSDLGRSVDVWPESGRGFELLLRIDGSTVPRWLFKALDGLLAQNFKIGAGIPIRLVPTLWCETVAVEGLEYLDTVNGVVRVVELLSPLGPRFGVDHNELFPPLPPDDEHRRTQVIWRLDRDGKVTEYSLCGNIVVIDGNSEQCDDRQHAIERFREELEQALQSRARASRVVRERRGKRTLHASSSPQEAEFLKGPGDATSTRVYRDFLLERGDPRGELAAWHEAGAQDELDFFWHHDSDLLLGNCGPHLPISEFTWSRGFLGSCFITRDRDIDRDYAQLVAEALALPFLATLRGLRVECPLDEEREATWKAIAHAPQASRLLRLSLNEEGEVESPELSWIDAGDLGPLLSALPRLGELRVRASRGRLGKLDHQWLRLLTIESTELSKERVDELVHAKAPLASLELWTGPNCDLDVLEPLFQRKGLKEFGLVNCDVTHEALPRLVRSPLFETLESLSFARGALIDEDVPVILAAAPSLKKLERFDVSENAFTSEGLQKLRRALPNLVSETQREEEEGERYVSVSE